MTVKARLYCSHISDFGPERKDVHFHAVYSNDLESPNYSYSLATPSANLTMTITNPDAMGYFQPKSTYDLAFSLVPPPAPEPKAAEAARGFEKAVKAAAVIIGLLALNSGLAGCAALQQITPPAPKTPAQTVYETRAALVTAEAAGLAYAQQVCPVAASCNNPIVTDIVESSIAADTAVTTAEQVVASPNPDATAIQQAVTKAQGALSAFQATLTKNGVKVPSSTNGSS